MKKWWRKSKSVQRFQAIGRVCVLKALVQAQIKVNNMLLESEGKRIFVIAW